MCKHQNNYGAKVAKKSSSTKQERYCKSSLLCIVKKRKGKWKQDINRIECSKNEFENRYGRMKVSMMLRETDIKEIKLYLSRE